MALSGGQITEQATHLTDMMRFILGEIAPVIDDSPEMEGLQVSLGSGDGRLFLLPEK